MAGIIRSTLAGRNAIALLTQKSVVSAVGEQVLHAFAQEQCGDTPGVT